MRKTIKFILEVIFYIAVAPLADSLIEGMDYDLFFALTLPPIASVALGPVDIQVGGGDSPGWDFLIQGSEMEVDLGSTCLERHTV